MAIIFNVITTRPTRHLLARAKLRNAFRCAEYSFDCDFVVIVSNSLELFFITGTYFFFVHIEVIGEVVFKSDCVG